MKTVPPGEDESTLVRCAQEGDQAALSRLYRHYLEDVYRFLYARTGSQTDAEDLTAEVFFKMLRSLDSYKGQSAFRNWLLGIARHTLLDFYRHQYAAPELPLERFRASLTAGPAPQPQATNNPEKSALLADVLQALPDHYRQILELRFIKACSIREAAQTMGISENYAKVLQHRALNKAAEIGAEQFDEVYNV